MFLHIPQAFDDNPLRLTHQIQNIRILSFIVIKTSYNWVPKRWKYTMIMSTKPHDDVIKWKHFPRYWPFVREIHRSPVNFPHKGQRRGALMFSLIYAWINDWVNNREAGDLRRQHGHYDVIVMHLTKGSEHSVHIWSYDANRYMRKSQNISFQNTFQI